MTDKKKTILEAVEKLTDTYRKEELFLGRDRERLPNKKEIINFIKDMRSIIFPGYFSVDSSASVFPEHYVAYRLNDLYDCVFISGGRRTEGEGTYRADYREILCKRTGDSAYAFN